MIGYKYRAINDFSLDIIKSDQIYLSKYTDFNDPFEFSTPFPNTKEMYKRAAKEIDALHKNNIFSDFYHSHLIKICTNIIKNGDDELNKKHELIREKMEHIGIYSLSKVNNEILMWSHYADNHRGFCIEFENLHINTKPQTKSLPVNYQSHFTDLDDPAIILKFYIDMFHNYIQLPEKAWQARKAKLSKILKMEDDLRGGISILTDKYEKWAYEQEFRLINEKNYGPTKINPKCIKSVTFGLRTTDNEINKIIDICKETGKHYVKFFKAAKAESSFNLEIKKI